MSAKSPPIATAVALLFMSSAGVARADNGAGVGQVRCFGINSCKGQSYCATVKNGCAGQNACKGKGWLKVSREECSAKGGQIFPEEEKK
jgi:uncharacterized membrane protein